MHVCMYALYACMHVCMYIYVIGYILIELKYYFCLVIT